MIPKKRIGEMLLEAGIIDETQLTAALGHQRQWGMRLGQALVDLKLASEADIVAALSAKLGVEIANLEAVDPHAQSQALKLFPREFALRSSVLPTSADTATVTVAMSDPTNLAIVDEIQFRTGRRVKVLLAGDRQIAEALGHAYPGGGEGEVVALDVEADLAIEGEAIFDPFGGGSKDALAAFTGAAPAPAAAAPAEPDRVEQLTLADEVTGEAILATDLVPPGEGEAGSRELTPQELAVLEALDRMAVGAQPEADVVKPAQAMAAVIRLLIRKRVVTEEELLDELRRR